jgi:hypothetical protein
MCARPCMSTSYATHKYINTNTPSQCAHSPHCRYGAGSTITLDFNRDTNTPLANFKSEVDQIVVFSGSIGEDYVGAWHTSRKLIITITDPQGHANYHDGGFVANLATVDANTPPHDVKAGDASGGGNYDPGNRKQGATTFGMII